MFEWQYFGGQAIRKCKFPKFVKINPGTEGNSTLSHTAFGTTLEVSNHTIQVGSFQDVHYKLLTKQKLS